MTNLTHDTTPRQAPLSVDPHSKDRSEVEAVLSEVDEMHGKGELLEIAVVARLKDNEMWLRSSTSGKLLAGELFTSAVRMAMAGWDDA